METNWKQIYSLKDSNQNIDFPLASFLQRLELAGFYLGPGQRLRLLRLLEGKAKKHLAEPEKLKYFLCPLIAKGTADQERFYEIFDQYWAELSQPWEMPEDEKTATPKSRFPDWLPWAMVGLVLLGAGWAADLLIEKAPPPLKVFSRHISETPGAVTLGDSLIFENLSENCDTAGFFRWEILDEKTGKREHADSTSEDLRMVMAHLGDSPKKQVRLTHVMPGMDTSYSAPLTIRCAAPPVIDSIYAETRDIKPGDSISFRAVMADAEGVNFQWAVGSGAEFAEGKKEHGHRFAEEGQFEVRVKALLPDTAGICETVKKLTVNVGRDKAYLTAKPLYLDPVDPTVNFSWGMWILLGLLGVAMIWYWVKWAARKAPEPTPEDDKADLEAAAERFAAPDKGPYFIPFRSQEGHIRVERDLYRLADVLRQRQEGLRQEMDVPNSVKKTIAGGGFPRLLTQSDTVPTEYLFLLDERSRNSHQGRLFEFMVNFMRKREVLGEIFYFNQRMHSFWNKNHPAGLPPEKLYRLHPRHRVILLSDGHALLEPSPPTPKGGASALRPEVKKLFFQWKNRLMLTPLPVVSWTWREGALHELFPIFPIHTGGLAEAAKYLERGMEDDEMKPTYASWCERLAAPPAPQRGESRRESSPPSGELEGAEPDVNYRRWRTATDHADYLKDHPKLFLWLKALAVYPKPDWNITLAIGRAISPLVGGAGGLVEYDNLLLLSRIPWLISGDLPNRLRREFLADLDPEVERLAREAVKNEMQAVEALVKGSHANREHRVELAMQDFNLAPQNADSQKLVQDLLALNLLTPRQVAELNEVVHREETRGMKAAASARPVRDVKRIISFLENRKTEAEPLEKPFLTSDFYRASMATLLYLILFVLSWKYGGTPELANFVGEDSASTTECEEEYLYAYFFKKECVADEAVLAQNQAVNIWNNALNDASSSSPNLVQPVAEINNQTVDSLFQKALALRPDYPLAQSNYQKFRFNLGEQQLRAFLDDGGGMENLTTADELFGSTLVGSKTPGPDSLVADALHGLGLAHFYGDISDEERASEVRGLEFRIEVAASELEGAKKTKDRSRAEIEKAEQKLAVLRKRLEATLQSTFTRDSARVFYAEIISRNETYFDSLETYPHLQSLIFKNEAGWLQLDVSIVDENGKPLDGVLVTSGETKELTEGGNFYLGMSLGERREFEFSKNKYETLQLSVTASEGEMVQTVRMKKIPVAEERDTDGDGVPDKADSCPKQPGPAANKGCPYKAFVYKKTPFGFNGCELEWGPLQKEVSLEDMVGMANEARAEGFTFQSSLGYGKLLVGTYPMGCQSAANLSWPLYLADIEKYKSPGNTNIEVDTDGDGVPDRLDKCPDEVGTAENNGCLPSEAPRSVPSKPEPQYRLLKSNFVAEPKVLKNRDFLDTLSFGGYVYEIILNELDRSGKASFEVTARGTRALPQRLPPLSPGRSDVFGLNGNRFRLEYLGQERRRVNGLRRDVALYVFYVEEGTDIFNDIKQQGAPEYDPKKQDGLGKTELLHPAILFLEQDMVQVKGGTFMMGCDPKYDGECNDNELPLHEVTLSDFSISKYEVTQELWEAVMGENPSQFNNCQKCPVDYVSWNDVQRFLKKLNEKMPNRNFRLPTEAEWEYAARGGDGKKRFRYVGSDDLDAVGWYDKNSGGKTHPIGQKQANGLGLYDMSGNVWEYCSDWSGKDYYKQFAKGGASNPTGASEGDHRVLRGGSWSDGPVRCAARAGYIPAHSYNHLGFRLVKD